MCSSRRTAWSPCVSCLLAAIYREGWLEALQAGTPAHPSRKKRKISQALLCRTLDTAFCAPAPGTCCSYQDCCPMVHCTLLLARGPIASASRLPWCSPGLLLLPHRGEDRSEPCPPRPYNAVVSASRLHAGPTRAVAQLARHLAVPSAAPATPTHARMAAAARVSKP